MMRAAVSSFATVAAASSTNLVTFDGAASTTFKFQELNDPVMGGKSTGTWTLGDGFGIMDGEVVDVPSLKAPGFIKAAADGTFPDLSEFIDGNLVLKVRSTTPEYAGFRVTFVSGAASASFACAAGGSLPFSRGCFKDKFSVPAGDDFVEVKLPFSGFSDKWSSATGEQTTTCAQDKDVCPTASKLSKIQRVEFWGEGAAGKLHLEIQSVSAEDVAGNRAELFASSSVSAVDLVTFDDASNWKALVDPVMGGQSVGTATVEDGHGILDGEVKIVPSLKAPGFVTAQADMKIDASAAAGGNLVMKVRSTTPDYTGFKISFAATTINPTLACATGGSTLLGRGCFKAPFTAPAGSDFTEVRIPLSEFSDKWSSATGELTTTCKDDASVCPSASKLKNVQRVSIWGEGVAGKIHIEVDSVALEPASQIVV